MVLGSFVRSAGRELLAVGIRLALYLGALALLAWVAMDMFPVVQAFSQKFSASDRPHWAAVDRPQQAFAIAFYDMPNTVYRALRETTGGGGRKDIITLDGNGRSAQVEIYRPGGALGSVVPQTEITQRVRDLGALEDVEAAPALDTRFGPVALIDFTLVDGERRRGCLGFVRTIEEPPLQITGWSCNAGPGMVGRTAIACAFDKLTLLSAGSDAKLAKLFAQAELKGSFCTQRRLKPSSAGLRPDWIDGHQAAKLRGIAQQ
jgi:hypothetical protein